ncbi:hypothetical protein GBA65_18255 [Rubrobacter marinus]|uniref:LysR substrate-binding domain-containing protein n=1 Tax=Rubrobacter marinus TaxID=2653852 RepID=A0A6G8Q121_9ACTN|nr:hypothetical protein GBA65_18255 [Rubrobacter marinus]
MGVVRSATHGVLTGLVGPFGERFPGVSLAAREMNSLAQVEALGAGRLDVGFLYLPPDRGPGDLEAETFAEEPLVAVLPAYHPLADSRRVRLDAMFGEPFVVADRAREPGWNEQFREACKGHGFAPGVAVETTELLVALGFVAAGPAWRCFRPPSAT